MMGIITSYLRLIMFDFPIFVLNFGKVYIPPKYKLSNEKGKVTEIPSDRPTDVRVLHLKFHNLTDIPDGSFQYFRLCKELNLDGNRIYRIHHNGFIGLSRLLTLSLARNYLPHIEPGTFFGHDTLTTLFLDHNKFKRLVKSMFKGGPKNLEILYARYNEIEYIENGTFDVMKNTLYRLKLSHNRLTHVERKMFSGLHMIRTLELSHNRISIIDPGAFYQVGELGVRPFFNVLNTSFSSLRWNIFIDPDIELKDQNRSLLRKRVSLDPYGNSFTCSRQMCWIVRGLEGSGLIAFLRFGETMYMKDVRILVDNNCSWLYDCPSSGKLFLTL